MNLCFFVVNRRIYTHHFCLAALEEGYRKLREQRVSEHVLVFIDNIFFDFALKFSQFGLQSVGRAAGNARLALQNFIYNFLRRFDGQFAVFASDNTAVSFVTIL